MPSSACLPNAPAQDGDATLLNDCEFLTICKDGRCGPSQCHAIKSLGVAKSYSPGETIFWEGDDADLYLLIKSGVARGVRFLADGRRQITRFMFPGNLVAHAGSGTYVYTAEAITPLEMMVIPRIRLDQLVGRNPCLGDLITRSILAELKESQDQVLVLGQMKATERVAHFILTLKQRLGGENGGSIEIPMNRNDIADYLGLTVETVSRVISRLKREGKISLIGVNKVSVSDPHQLDQHWQSFAA